MDAPRSLLKSEGHTSVARVTNAWYVACESKALRDKPLAAKLLGIPLALFRGANGKAAALLDRCAHRNVPLSLGQVVDCRLQCSYHGWQFDHLGACKVVPSLTTDPGWKKALVPSFPVVEQEGYVWVYATPGEAPDSLPYKLPSIDEKGYTTVRRVVEVEGTLHATIENALDVPHTAFLHRGLFRGSAARNKIRAVTKRTKNRVVTEYIGEPRPEGVVGKLLSPSGGTVTHFDRFIMPSIAQVEYSIGDENHMLVTSICAPVDDFMTRMYAVVTFRMRIPGSLVKAVLNPIAMKIFRQDAEILKIQTAAIQRFGGESYTSTEIDVMGPQIWRLLRRAELGKDAGDDDDDWTRETELEVG